MKHEDREQMQGRLRGREKDRQLGKERGSESPPFGSTAGVSFMSSVLGSEAVSQLGLACMCAAKCCLISLRISQPQLLISPNQPTNTTNTTASIASLCDARIVGAALAGQEQTPHTGNQQQNTLCCIMLLKRQNSDHSQTPSSLWTFCTNIQDQLLICNMVAISECLLVFLMHGNSNLHDELNVSDLKVLRKANSYIPLASYTCH